MHRGLTGDYLVNTKTPGFVQLPFLPHTAVFTQLIWTVWLVILMQPIFYTILHHWIWRTQMDNDGSKSSSETCFYARSTPQNSSVSIWLLTSSKTLLLKPSLTWHSMRVSLKWYNSPDFHSLPFLSHFEQALLSSQFWLLWLWLRSLESKDFVRSCSCHRFGLAQGISSTYGSQLLQHSMLINHFLLSWAT